MSRRATTVVSPGLFARLDDLQLFQAILSSADFFPGLYRMRTSWWDHFLRPECMDLFGLLEAAHRSGTGTKWSRSQWFSANEALHETAFGTGSRNEQRSEQDLREFLRERAIDRTFRPRSYSLAVIDTGEREDGISAGATYYLMGSLICFEESRTLIGYDHSSGSYALSLSISHATAARLVEDWFSPPELSRLFLRAESVASLSFQEDDVGLLECRDEILAGTLASFAPSTPVVAAPITSPRLPIRFAKPLAVSHVCRME